MDQYLNTLELDTRLDIARNLANALQHIPNKPETEADFNEAARIVAQMIMNLTFIRINNKFPPTDLCGIVTVLQTEPLLTTITSLDQKRIANIVNRHLIYDRIYRTFTPSDQRHAWNRICVWTTNEDDETYQMILYYLIGIVWRIHDAVIVSEYIDISEIKYHTFYDGRALNTFSSLIGLMKDFFRGGVGEVTSQTSFDNLPIVKLLSDVSQMHTKYMTRKAGGDNG